MDKITTDNEASPSSPSPKDPDEFQKDKDKPTTSTSTKNPNNKLSSSSTLTLSSSSKKKQEIAKKFADPKLDPTWLFSQLRKEICKEVTYDLENDAKLRAVNQGTLNYEQFRQMVLGAGLRPLDMKKDMVEGCQNGRRPYVVWNNAVGGGRGKKQGDGVNGNGGDEGGLGGEDEGMTNEKNGSIFGSKTGDGAGGGGDN